MRTPLTFWNALRSGDGTGGVYDWRYLPAGASRIASIPALVLLGAFIGFGALAREADLPLAQLAFMVPAIWALPSHLILLGGIVAGTPLPVVAVAVALASVRMLPMVMALMPLLRVEGTRVWHLFAVSNLVAITAWVHVLERADDLPTRGRLPYFVGFAGTMMIATTIVASITYVQAAVLPALVMAGLYFLTPLYFSTSVWRSAALNAERFALLAGFVAGPVAMWLLPQSGLLVGGLAAGFAGFAFWIVTRRC